MKPLLQLLVLLPLIIMFILMLIPLWMITWLFEDDRTDEQKWRDGI